MELHVPLRQKELRDLMRLARAEHRRPQDQAALLLTQALKSRAPELDDLTPQPLVAA